MNEEPLHPQVASTFQGRWALSKVTVLEVTNVIVVVWGVKIMFVYKYDSGVVTLESCGVGW